VSLSVFACTCGCVFLILFFAIAFGQICRGRDKGASDDLSFQLQDPAGLAWLSVPPKRGLFVVNTGDMLERLANGSYRSNLHRVFVGPGGPERQSVAVFFEPALDAVISPLSCCCEGDPSRYPPVTSGEFLLHKYAATGEGGGSAAAKNGD
jgi:hypothetical protein